MTAINHPVGFLHLQPACADCGRRGGDVDLTTKPGDTSLVNRCPDCARPAPEVLEVERRVWLPQLAAEWVTGTCQDSDARSVVDRLRPDVSPMVRLALLDALGWAVLSGRDVTTAYDALIGAAPDTTPQTTQTEEAAW